MAHFVPGTLWRAVAQAHHRQKQESETYDIYLLPPNEDPETCQSWLRMRNRDGRYNLMFEEWVVDGPFIISPRITFEVRREPQLPRQGPHWEAAQGWRPTKEATQACKLVGTHLVASAVGILDSRPLRAISALQTATVVSRVL